MIGAIAKIAEIAKIAKSPTAELPKCGVTDSYARYAGLVIL